MPMLNGLEAGRQVKQMLPNVKLIYLTMNPDPEVAAAFGVRSLRLPAEYMRVIGSGAGCA